ncbi:MAG TPA: hypothetical protein VGT61_09820 [Thermomicrobiales bacterium]|nr:hypothetical protein [Thermomicrobiales bacterium]
MLGAGVVGIGAMGGMMASAQGSATPAAATRGGAGDATPAIVGPGYFLSGSWPQFMSKYWTQTEL